ncbi:membrane-spanning 4-domains subfamily A member 8-like [Rhynchocyon petersi]
MNHMASPGPPSSSMFLVTTQNNYPVAPGVISQIPLYPNAQPQIHLSPGNVPGVMQYVSVPPAQRALKEGKVLGALQILIGLLHLVFSPVLLTVLRGYYVAISVYGGFPFWGGITFIISGALSVSAEKQPGSYCLLKSSTGMNIVSAIFAAIGVTLFITDISIAGSLYGYSIYDTNYYRLDGSTGIAASSALLLFCCLEFCIACASSHFGCQMVCYQPNNIGVVIPNVYTATTVVVPEPENPPPEYPDVQVSK